MALSNLLNRDRDSWIAAGGTTVRDPVTRLRIIDAFENRAVGFRFRIGPKDFFGCRDAVRARHEVNGYRSYGAGLVVIHLYGFVIVEHVEILLGTLVTWGAEFLSRFVGGHADVHAANFLERRLAVFRRMGS